MKDANYLAGYNGAIEFFEKVAKAFNTPSGLRWDTLYSNPSFRYYNPSTNKNYTEVPNAFTTEEYKKTEQEFKDKIDAALGKDKKTPDKPTSDSSSFTTDAVDPSKPNPFESKAYRKARYAYNEWRNEQLVRLARDYARHPERNITFAQALDLLDNNPRRGRYVSIPMVTPFDYEHRRDQGEFTFQKVQDYEAPSILPKENNG